MSGDTTPFFSAVSVWEVAVKAQRKRSNFNIEPEAFRTSLLASGYTELPITSVHAAGVTRLASLHGDPFDRLLVSQASAEGLTLVTADARLSLYPGLILQV